MTPEQVTQLERWIDGATDQLQPLKSFVLPGGTTASAHLHLARTVCRRAEIKILLLAESTPINPQVTIYLNRLSDLLFVWARFATTRARATSSGCRANSALLRLESRARSQRCLLSLRVFRHAGRVARLASDRRSS